MSRIPPDVHRAVTERCAGYCEVCGLPLGHDRQLHHRKPRGSGGKGQLDTAVNLLVCHARGHWAIHARPQRAYAMGWLVHTGDDPGAVPVVLNPGLCGRL